MEELDLKELFEMFWSRKLYVLIIVLVFFLIGCIYSFNSDVTILLLLKKIRLLFVFFKAQ